ncbi:hypothetical protein Tco_0766798 [Tanacetum coccineum]
MASDGSDQDARYALSKLSQRGTVAEYESEFLMLIKRVTWISKSLLKSFYMSGLKPALQCALLTSNPTTLSETFSLARATEARFAKDALSKLLQRGTMSNTKMMALQIELLKTRPTTLVEAFSLARIIEARFEAITHEDKATAEKEQSIKETANAITSLQSDVEKLPMKLQLKNNFREALETKLKDLEKTMLDLNPTLHDLQKVVVDQKKKHYKTKYALNIIDEEFKEAKSEATTKIRKLVKVYGAWLPPWLAARSSFERILSIGCLLALCEECLCIRKVFINYVGLFV